MSTTTTIREIIQQLYIDDVIADYLVRVYPDCIRVDLHDGGWIEVDADLDPAHPDDDPTGYVWTAYAADATPCGTGGDSELSTLADIIRRLAS